MKVGDTCPVCEKGSLFLSTYSRRLTHRGASLEVSGLVAWECDACGDHTMEPEQIRANNARLAQVKREHADAQRSSELLPTDEVRQVRTLLGLTQSEAAQVFRGGANAFSKYERGEVIQSEPMDLLLRLARDVPAAAKWLRERAGLAAVAKHEFTNIVGSIHWSSSAFAGYWIQAHTPIRAPILPVLPAVAENDEDDELAFSREWQQQSTGIAAAGGS